MDKTIRGLRLKIWLLLTSTFIVIYFLAGVLIFTIFSNNIYQTHRNSINSLEFSESIRTNGLTSPDYFTVELNKTENEVIIFSEFDLGEENYMRLIDWSLSENQQATNFLTQFLINNHRIIEANNRYWTSTYMEDFDTA
ncbi:MAG: hypothetical protein LBV67_01650 [Streptococcaceae bacterium]|jgi:hypothetical protein|nr:hypothetical protein [Streptococcaceae bacterium]